MKCYRYECACHGRKFGLDECAHEDCREHNCKACTLCALDDFLAEVCQRRKAEPEVLIKRYPITNVAGDLGLRVQIGFARLAFPGVGESDGEGRVLTHFELPGGEEWPCVLRRDDGKITVATHAVFQRLEGE